MINIQTEIQKIHSQYGISEMSNYKIQLLFEKYAEEYHNSIKVVKNIYPSLEDIRNACQTIANNVDDFKLMLSKAETVQLQQLTTKWLCGLRKHKKDVINEMINDLK